jgi:DNA repair protein RecN (Recombination protein N)
VTHVALGAAGADHHYVVSKAERRGQGTTSDVQPVAGEARVAEVARMLGGEHLAGTSLAHAEALLQKRPVPAAAPARAKRRTRA